MRELYCAVNDRIYRDDMDTGDGIKRDDMETKCRKCHEPLHALISVQTGTKTGGRQCINHDCKRYGVAT